MSRARSTPTGISTGHGDLAASLVLVFPLLLAYEVGVLFDGHVNGADMMTRLIYGVVGSRAGYLLVHAAIAAGFLLWIRHTRRWSTLRLEVAGPVILEAAVYALTLGAVGSLIVDRVLGLGLSGSSVVSAIGAGVHEELVFRLGLFTVLAAGIARVIEDRRISFVLALAGSAAVFSLAHHAGAHGEPWSAHAFAFRCVAGSVFGLVFWYRSLAHAVYAHVLYDILIAAG